MPREGCADLLAECTRRSWFCKVGSRVLLSSIPIQALVLSKLRELDELLLGPALGNFR